MVAVEAGYWTAMLIQQQACLRTSDALCSLSQAAVVKTSTLVVETELEIYNYTSNNLEHPSSGYSQ